MNEGRRLLVSIGACIVGNLLLRAGSAAAISAISLYLAHLDRFHHPVPATFLGVLAAVFYTTELLTAPIFGALSDRFGRKNFMQAGGIFGAVAILALPILPALPLFVAARLAEGLSSASSIPAVLGYLADETTGSAALRGRIMAAFEVATVLGFAGGLALGGFLWNLQGPMAFYSIACVYLLAMGTFTMVKHRGQEVRKLAREEVSKGKPAFSGLRRILRNRTVTGFIPAWISVNAILGVWFAHLSFQMARQIESPQLLVGGFSGTGVGLVSGGFALAFGIGTAGWAAVFGRIKTRTIMAVSLQAIAWCAILIYALNHTPEDALGRIWIFAGAIAITVLIISGFTPAALAYLAEMSEAFPENRGGMMGLYSVLLGLGQLIGGWLGGYFAEAYAVDGLILLTVVLGLAANASMFAISRNGRGNGAIMTATKTTLGTVEVGQ